MKLQNEIRRVWVNCPSTTQPYHEFHGKIGIAFPEDEGFSRLFFTEGAIISIRIATQFLANSTGA